MEELKHIYDIIGGVYDNTYQDAYYVLECIAKNIYYPFKDGRCVCKQVDPIPVSEEHVNLIRNRAAYLCRHCHEYGSETKPRILAVYKLRGLMVAVTIAYCHGKREMPVGKLGRWGELLAITCTGGDLNSMYMELWGDCISAINRVLTCAVRSILRGEGSEAIDYVMFGTVRSVVSCGICKNIEWLAQSDVTDKPVEACKVIKALDVAHTENLLLWLSEVPDSQRSPTGFGYDTLCLEIGSDLSGCAAAQFCIKTKCPVDMMIDYLQYCTMASERQTAWGYNNAGMNSGVDVVDPAFSAINLVETTGHLRALDWLTNHGMSGIARLLAHIYVITTMSSKMWNESGSGIAEADGVDPELLALFCVSGGGWAHQCVIELGNWSSDILTSYTFQKDTKLPVAFLDNGNLLLGIGVGIQLAVYDFSSPNASKTSIAMRRRGMLNQLNTMALTSRRDRQVHWALSSGMWQ
jgi:hypothetical protein